MHDLSIRFLFDECGATAIEYALIAGSIALVLIATINAIGGKVLVGIAGALAGL